MKSDAFTPTPSAEPVLECRATMLNINYGHNKTLLNSCRRLHDYSYFIAKVNEYIDNKCTMYDAIDRAIDDCIQDDVLADILVKCKREVTSMLLTEFDEKLHKKTVYNEGYEDGHKSGVSEGFERGHKYGVNEGFERGISEGYDKARENDISHSINMLRNMGISDDKIICLIAENYDISKEYITQKLSTPKDL